MPNDNFNQYCQEFLDRQARRNQQDVAQRLDTLCGFLRQRGEVVQTMFGGSVRRGTDVTGISDVDVLLIVNDSSLATRPPSDAIRYVRDAIQEHLRNNRVTAGGLAVTVNYADGMEIQVLPAIRRSDGVRIGNPGNSGWSNVAHPDRFAEELGRVNRANNGAVIPTIRLAKALADRFVTRRDRKITGYHMEALAVDAFRSYRGARDHKSMLIHLLTYSMGAVMNPVTDSTGQSRYVDERLGAAESLPRKQAQTYFGQMRGKVRNCNSRKAFNALF